MKSYVIITICIGILYQLNTASATCADACAPACLNGGVRATNGCGCTCATGFTGPQCQYAQDPCTAVDSTSCSKINCYNGTSEQFFGCQAKCLCCRNKQCFNGGRVVGAANGACTCACFSVAGVTKYDAASNCQNMLAGQCTDDQRCSTQFGVYGSTRANCQYDFVKYICPKTCGVCT